MMIIDEGATTVSQDLDSPQDSLDKPQLPF